MSRDSSPSSSGSSEEPERKRGRESLDREQGANEDGPAKRQRADDVGPAEDAGPPEDAQEPQANGAGAAANGAAAGPVAASAAEGGRKPLNLGRTGGVYIPPYKLARMMQEVKDRSSPEYQKLTWEALKKSINGIVNKVNTVNIKNMLAEVFRENLIRGRGLFCRSMMKSQLASPTFSPVYAALVSVVNTKFPELGELLLHRLCLQFIRSYKRNDKPVCTAAARFLGQLINQGVAHEVLALEMLILMLEKPSADSVEMACEFTKEVGAYLQDVAPQGLYSVFERFRAILHDGQIDKRIQFVIEGLIAVRRAGFEASGHPAVKPELDLVEAEDQITHEISLDEPHDPQTSLDIFKFDPEYEQHEKEFKAISREILGEEESSEEEDGHVADGSDESEEETDEEERAAQAQQQAQQQQIEDETNTNLVNLRRTIYLTIMSSMAFEEAGHKLMKIPMQEGQEHIMAEMIIECCAQERTYKAFYGLLAQRFCHLKRVYMASFEEKFRDQFATIHRLETNKLRNVAHLFAHLLTTDAIPWSVLDCMRLTEEDTTSASRIFIKYLFQEMSSSMGVLKLAERLNDPTCQQWYDGIFPKDTQAHLRFAINFFTSIGLGGLTDKMRELYKEMPRIAAERAAKEKAAADRAAARHRALHGGDTTDDDSSSSSDSDTSSGSSSSGSDSSDSDSDSDSSSSDSDTDSDSSSSDSEDSRARRRRGKDSGRGRGKGGRDSVKAGGGSRAPKELPPPPRLPPPPPARSGRDDLGGRDDSREQRNGGYERSNGRDDRRGERDDRGGGGGSGRDRRVRDMDADDRRDRDRDGGRGGERDDRGRGDAGRYGDRRGGDDERGDRRGRDSERDRNDRGRDDRDDRRRR